MYTYDKEYDAARRIANLAKSFDVSIDHITRVYRKHGTTIPKLTSEQQNTLAEKTNFTIEEIARNF